MPGRGIREAAEEDLAHLFNKSAAGETVREGLTRRAYDAITVLTKQVQDGKLPIQHAFYGLTALYDTISPFCSVDGKTTLDTVMKGWRDTIDADERLEAGRQRQANILARREGNTPGVVEEAWG